MGKRLRKLSEMEGTGGDGRRLEGNGGAAREIKVKGCEYRR